MNIVGEIWDEKRIPLAHDGTVGFHKDYGLIGNGISQLERVSSVVSTDANDLHFVTIIVGANVGIDNGELIMED